MPSSRDTAPAPGTDPAPPARGDLSVLIAVAVGGVVGAEARYGVAVAVPHPGAQLPVSTLLINTTGSLLLGVLMVLVVERATVHRLARPFLGVGVLGGYTTFSGFAVDVRELFAAGRPAAGLAYCSLSLIAGWAAAWLGIRATRRFVPATGPRR